MKTGFQQNRFLISYAVIVLLGIGGLGYFLFQSKSNFDAATEEYETALRRLHTLQTRKPFPEEKNLKQLQDLQGQYKTEIKSLAENLKSKELPLKEITPQIFQDRLRRVVSEVEKRASEQNVLLPTNFYMGFDRYKNSLPQAHTVNQLGRQLESIAIIVNKMLDLKVREIISVSRQELPGESGTPAERSNKIVSTSSFDIIFIADQGKFRQVFNSILDANQFFVIRNLAILNSNPQGPSRKDDHPAGQSQQQTARKAQPQPPHPTTAQILPPLALAGAPPPIDNSPSQPGINKDLPEAPSIRVVVGQETLAIALRIDQVNFEVPEIK